MNIRLYIRNRLQLISHIFFLVKVMTYLRLSLSRSRWLAKPLTSHCLTDWSEVWVRSLWLPPASARRPRPSPQTAQSWRSSRCVFPSQVFEGALRQVFQGLLRLQSFSSDASRPHVRLTCVGRIWKQLEPNSTAYRASQHDCRALTG